MSTKVSIGDQDRGPYAQWLVRRAAVLLIAGAAMILSTCPRSSAADSPEQAPANQLQTAQMLSDYYEQMSVPKPFDVRAPNDWKAYRDELRKKVLKSVGLLPLPDRVPLDVHRSEPLDHPWCTVRRIHYQLWPGVYSAGLLFMPKTLAEQPSPAMLCPHGHWKDGNAHPEVQKRCLNFARLGYVTFSPPQDHYEDLYIGVSHQTLMIWNNMRAVDYLESLPQVDNTRIGVAGASGGGLQTQMLTALDDRVKAATVVGLTCDFREIMFPERHHCVCNHFPGVMRFTDHPEISTLGLPTPLQFLTMNDWTKNFQRDNLPAIQKLYAAAGLADRVDCKYYDTPHSYDKQKRERTYWWMERWVRGRAEAGPVSEPDDVETFLVQTLKDLSAEVPGNKGFQQIGRIYMERRGYKTPRLNTVDEWVAYRQEMLLALRDLLGLDAELPRAHSGVQELGSQTDGGLTIEHVAYPSEGGLLIPTIVVRRRDVKETLPVVMLFSEDAKESLLAETGSGSARQLAEDGSLVVLPDVRCHGAMFATGGKTDRQQAAWERNGIVWGRPESGMACTDMRAVLDGILGRTDADLARVKMISRKSAGLAAAVLSWAALDPRVKSADVDLSGCCYGKRNLPLVSGVLEYGDVLEWSALLGDRKLTLRGVPSEAGDPAWLAGVFALTGNSQGLQIEP